MGRLGGVQAETGSLVSRYRIRISRKARRELERLGNIKPRRQIDQLIDGLAHEPKPRIAQRFEHQKLAAPLFRIFRWRRVIIYRVDDDEKLVSILVIRHRDRV